MLKCGAALWVFPTYVFTIPLVVGMHKPLGNHKVMSSDSHCLYYDCKDVLCQLGEEEGLHQVPP